METKRVTEDFMDRSSVPWTPGDIAYIMKKIEDIFEECDEALENAEMERLGYEKQPIDVMTEHMAILISYVFNAYRQCCDELDQTLYVGFKNGATEILSNIVLDEITTDNTFNMQEYVEVNDAGGSFSWTQIKPKLTMKDFLGVDEVLPGQGAPVIENMETIGWFKELFRADYENKGASVASVEQLLDFYLYAGEYDHKGYHPVRDFLSGIADFTIIIPFIESICGYDFITQEKLTDYESGMKFVNAAVGAVTLGQGTMALKLAGAGGKEIAAGLLKTWAVDALADASAYTVGYACDELGLPVGITLLASLATGCMVSVNAGRYIFTDPVSGIVVKEADADGMQAFVKEMDVDLGDMVWGGGIRTNKAGIEAYESLLGSMPEEELKKYVKFLENGSTAGMTPEELLAIRKVDERLLLDQIDYDEILALRKGLSEGGSDVLKVSNWDDMKDAYKGTITQFVKENKPKYSPDIKKWFDNGGSIEIQNLDGKQIWTYTSSAGDSVPYIDGYIKFPDEYLNPTIKSVDIGEFSGDRGKDIDKMLSILEEDYGITEIPEGYIVHHDIENGILQLVDENIHTEFTHIGGHSIYK